MPHLDCGWMKSCRGSSYSTIYPYCPCFCNVGYLVFAHFKWTGGYDRIADICSQNLTIYISACIYQGDFKIGVNTPSVTKDCNFVLKQGRWVSKKGRWMDKLIARLLATAALRVRIQTSLKNTKWAI